MSVGQVVALLELFNTQYIHTWVVPCHSICTMRRTIGGQQHPKALFTSLYGGEDILVETNGEAVFGVVVGDVSVPIISSSSQTKLCSAVFNAHSNHSLTVRWQRPPLG